MIKNNNSKDNNKNKILGIDKTIFVIITIIIALVLLLIVLYFLLNNKSINKGFSSNKKGFSFSNISNNQKSPTKLY